MTDPPRRRAHDDGPAPAAVLAEIDAEVAERMASGELPPGLAGELDDLFRSLSPTGDRVDRRRRSVELVARRAVVDVNVPLASSRPGGRVAKRLVRKAVGWYARFFAAQLAAFAAAVARALRLVSDDLDGLRRSVADLAGVMPDAAASPESSAPPGPPRWVPLVAPALAGRPGRVLHAHCGPGSALDALRGAGVDAYGAEPSAPAAAAARSRGFEVHQAGVTEHLRDGGASPLAGVVLDGSVLWMTSPAREALAAAATGRLAPGGVLVVVSPTPDEWARRAGPVLTDLAPGRPWQAETWAFVLERSGLGRIETHRQGPPDAPTEFVVLAYRPAG